MGQVVNITESRATLPVYSTLGASLGRPIDITNNTTDVLFLSSGGAYPIATDHDHDHTQVL